MELYRKQLLDVEASLNLMRSQLEQQRQQQNDSPQMPALVCSAETLSSVASSTSSETDRCRYCLSAEVTANEPFISPCTCTGSLKYVHRSCLEKWLNIKRIQHCDLCHFIYDVEWKYKPLREWECPEIYAEDLATIILIILMMATLALLTTSLIELAFVKDKLPIETWRTCMAGIGMAEMWFLIGNIIVVCGLYSSDCFEDFRYCSQKQVIVIQDDKDITPDTLSNA